MDGVLTSSANLVGAVAANAAVVRIDEDRLEVWNVNFLNVQVNWGLRDILYDTMNTKEHQGP